MSQSTKMIAISEVARIVTGKTPSTKESLLWNGDTPFVTPGDLQFLKNIINTGRTVSDTACVKMAKQLLPARTICVSCIGNLGYVGMTTKRSLSNQQINSLIPNNEKDAEYLYYAMKNLWQFFKKLEGQSTTLSILNKSQFSRICIPWPDEITRKQIGQTLSLIDSKIELNTQLNGYLEEQCEAVANHEKGLAVELSSLCDLVKEKADYNEADFDTYVSTESLLPGKKGRQAPSSLPQTGNVTVYKAGDILVSNIRPYFKKIWYADRTGTCSGDVLVFRTKQPEQSGYLYSCMRSDAFFDYVMKGAKGTKMPRGDKKQMLTYKVASNPSGATVDFIESALSQASSSSKENHRLAALRDNLLPKLMSGEIDVSKVDLKQLNSHLAETLRPFGCHIPAIQKTGRPALLRTAPHP